MVTSFTSLAYESGRNKFEVGGWYEKEHFNLARRFYTVGANDPARLACPAEQAAWVDWTIEQVVSGQLVSTQAGLS